MKALLGILVLAFSVSASAEGDVKGAVESAVAALFGNTAQTTDAFLLGEAAADNAQGADWDVTLNLKPNLILAPGYTLSRFDVASVVADQQKDGEMAAILYVDLVEKGTDDFSQGDFKTAAQVSVVQLFGRATDNVEVTEVTSPVEVEGATVADYEVALNDFSGPAAGSVVYKVSITKFSPLVDGKPAAKIQIDVAAGN